MPPSCCVIYLLFWTSFEWISAICLKLGRLSTQVEEELAQFLGTGLKTLYLCINKRLVIVSS
jgi:hypothetical protein